MNPIEPLFLRPIEAAKVLGVCRSKIYEMVLAEELPSIRLGGSVRIPRRALVEMEQRAVEGARKD